MASGKNHAEAFAHLGVSKGTLYTAPPGAFKIGGPGHFLYDPTSRTTFDEVRVQSIMKYGMDAPIHVVRIGELLWVHRGRGRVLDAQEAERRLKKARKPFPQIPYLLFKADDQTAREMIDVENFHRRIPGPLDYTMKVNEYRRHSYPDDQICFLLKIVDRRGRALEGAAAKSACDEYEALTTLDPQVAQALADHEITKTLALQLAKLPREVQVERLEKMRAAGATRGKAASDIAAGKDPAAPRLKTLPAPVLSGLREQLAARPEANTMLVRFARAFVAWQMGDPSELADENPGVLEILDASVKAAKAKGEEKPAAEKAS